MDSSPRLSAVVPLARLVRTATVAVAAVSFLPGFAEPLEAQYFGRNKVQYDNFDFRVLSTPHFDIHFYPEKEEALEDVARMAERWYERLARLFQHEFEATKPLIFYADHPDFQQTNTIGGQIGEGTGGVTEGLKDRVVMPLAGAYADTDHVLGHELAHAFQFNIAQSRRGGGLQALMRLPLWFVEGMAEHLSVGNEDPLTAMWLRDALLRDDLPTARQMTRETRFFPYRFGQAFWSYVGGTYGDEAVVRVFRTALRAGWEPAIERVLGLHSDSLSARWHEELETHYRPLMEGKDAPGEAGTLLLAPSTGAGYQNLAPSLSPDGRYLAFISEKDLFSFDLYLADARTGRILRKLASSSSDPHFDALRFIDSSGAWSPDGRSLAVSVFAQGSNQLVVYDVATGRARERISVDGEIGEITGPAWSPDGTQIVFSGQIGGMTDLFLLDLDTRDVERLTRDRHADYQPTFSPDGSRIAFVSDRGPETDFDRLTYSQMRLAILDLEEGSLEVLEAFGNVRHSNPQFSPDGRSLYFLSDQDGFSDIYRLGLEERELRRVTRVATAVSGITRMSPAMSVARSTGTVVFSVFDEFQFHIYSMDSREALGEEGELVTAAESPAPGRFLPPAEPRVRSRVAAYLSDPHTGLREAGTFSVGEAPGYSPALELDYIGQPMIGAGTDQFGNFVSGSTAAFFSDMLGNRTLGVALQAQGTVKDIGGQAFYQNLESRWNWGVSGGRIPYLLMRTGISRDPSNGHTLFIQDRQRIFINQAHGLLSYPFSTTRRVDFTAGVRRYSFDLEREFLEFDPYGRLVAHDRERMHDLVPDPLNLFETSVALVGDNSFFGFASPVRGHRYRFELRNTVGSLNYQTLTADFRRYFNPWPELTFAVRGLHLGRYGEELHDSVIQPFFLGWETFVRGYSPQSFELAECGREEGGGGGCPQFERLFGHRVAVANAEIRVPLIGSDRFGIMSLPFLPTELVAFADAGLAWDDRNEPEIVFSRTNPGRVPVFSTGLSARMNLMGFLVMEIYYAVPWQRPGRGGHFGFHVAPGW